MKKKPNVKTFKYISPLVDKPEGPSKMMAELAEQAMLETFNIMLEVIKQRSQLFYEYSDRCIKEQRKQGVRTMKGIDYRLLAKAMLNPNYKPPQPPPWEQPKKIENENEKLKKELLEAKEKLEKAKEALRFYAEEKHRISGCRDYSKYDNADWVEGNVENGQKAREALKEIEE